MNAISVNATGQEIRPEIADFDIERWAFAQAVIEQEQGHEQEQEQEERSRLSSAKNYRPPRQMGVKGGCSPQNNRGKP